MKIFNLSLSLSLRRAFLLIFSLMCAWQVQAQEREVEDKDDIFSKVRIDTIHIKATPYERVLENCVWKDEDKQIDYYNDITIYEISKKEPGQPSALMTGPKPAIFMLPGGGFFQHTPIDTIGQKSLGVRLASEYGAICYIIYYQLPANPDTLNLIKNSVIVQNRGNGIAADSINCNDVQNGTGKARLEEASYKAFHDLRRLLRIEYANKASQRGIDTNRFVLIGSSSGSVLALNALFLHASEIPSTITYNIACPSGSNIITIDVKDSVRNGYWPIPKIKGIVSMAGAWIYDSTKLVSNTPESVYRTPIFLLHGTCDNLINRRVARIGFKRSNLGQNLYPANRFIRGYGSEYIFNQFKNTHDSLLYGQVLRGGHAPFQNLNLILNVGGWEKENIGANDNTIMNQLRPFLNNIIKDSLKIETRAYAFNPLYNTVCATFDTTPHTICFQKIYNPNTTYTATLCDTITRQAIVQYIHPDANYSWSVNTGANISIQGSNVGTTISYKRIANINKTDTLKVSVTRPCAEPKTFSYVVQSKNPTASFTPTISPSGWNTICSANKTATLLGVPAGTPAPVWTAAGNIEIVSSSGNSVTYKRKNNILSTGVLIATFSGTCGSPQFNYTVNTHPFPTLGNWINTFGIVSQCDFGIVTNSPSKIPNGTQATFSTIYSNAVANGVTDLLWDTDCISGVEAQTWLGNDLREDFTITATTGCTYVRVRPQNICGTGSWRTTGISVQSCGGGFSMMVAPNPATSQLDVTLYHEDEKKVIQAYTLQLIDAMGNTVLKTTIENGKQQLNLSELKEGVYKALINTEDELLYKTFHVGR